MNGKERNQYIDMLKGIAALGIISIHTAFYAGVAYTPIWFRSMTLLLDVPFFFFLSGWASSCRDINLIRTTKGLGKIWIKWIYFTTILALLCLCIQYFIVEFGGGEENVLSFRELIRNYMFMGSFTGFPVVGGSVWFLRYYFIVVFVNTAFLQLIDKYYEEFSKFYCIMLIVIFVWISYGLYFFAIDGTVIFYSFFWMLGRRRKDIKIESWKKLFVASGIVMAGYLLSSYLLDIPLNDIQSAKFPPTLMYGFCSCIVIILAIYLEPHIKSYNRWLVHVGKNAIFYFFGQGMGSSLNYYIVARLNIPFWPIKWIVTFICNILITGMIAESLAHSYQLVYKMKRKLNYSKKHGSIHI